MGLSFSVTIMHPISCSFISLMATSSVESLWVVMTLVTIMSLMRIDMEGFPWWFIDGKKIKPYELAINIQSPSFRLFECGFQPMIYKLKGMRISQGFASLRSET
jgi:hypothetical protein